MAKSFEDFDTGDIVSLDTETTGLRMWHGDSPFAVSMCNVNGETWYCEWKVDPYTRLVYPDAEELKFVRDVMEDPTITKVMHNAKFDVRMLECNYGIKLLGRLEETLFAARVVDSDETSYGLKPLAEKYLGIGQEDLTALKEEVRRARVWGKGQGYNLAEEAAADYWILQYWAGWSPDLQEELCEQYAVLDAVRTMGLWTFYQDAMCDLNVRGTYDREMAIWRIVYAMETKGVGVNYPLILEEAERNEHLIKDAVAAMCSLADNPKLNPNSDTQIAKILTNRYGLIPTLTTNSGKPSMAYNSIRQFTDHPFVHELMIYKGASKVLNTCLSNYRSLAVPDPLNVGGYALHPNYNQGAARTGRFSCNSPNLQQVVNSDGARNAVEAMNARLVFGPRPGYHWVAIDMEQLELRMFADISGEESMQRYIADGHDLHAECANKAWGGKGNPVAITTACIALELDAEYATEKVRPLWEQRGWDTSWKLDRATKDSFASEWLDEFDWDIVKAEASVGKKVARTRAKFVMYAKIYGGGPQAIVGFLYCSLDDARTFQRDYNNAFPRIPKYIKEMAGVAERNRCVYNPYGRRLSIQPELSYKATNYLIQSSAADLLKLGMMKTHNYLVDNDIDGALLMTIHDELMFEIREEYITKEVIDALKLRMEDHEGAFKVELPCSASRIRERWDVKEKFDF